MLQRHSTRVNNLTLSYIDEGKGDTIVLIHGFCGSPAYWEDIIPKLSETNRVIVPALRGHGKSSAVNEPFSIDDMALDIKLLLEELSIPKVTMIGHSLGGYVTLSFAERYPDILSGFGLVHSTALPDSEEARQGRTDQIKLICENGIEPLIKKLIPKLFSPANGREMTDAVEFVTEIGLNTSVTGAKGALRAMRERPNRQDVIKNTTLPVLLVAGEEDQIIPVGKVYSIEAKNTMKTLMEKTGHLGMIERTGKLLEIIIEFKKFINQKS
ncbi:alpha/beta fold hydrolase [Bacillus sp. AK128]